MSRLMFSLLYGVVVAVLMFFWIDPFLTEWAGLREGSKNPLIWALQIGALAGFGAYWPKNAGLIAIGAFVILSILAISLTAPLSTTMQMIGVILGYTMPMFLPFAWSTDYFNLFQNARRKSS